MSHRSRFYKSLSIIVFAGLIIAALAIRSFAFTGPSASGGTGSGAVGVSSSNNVSVGTSTPAANTKFLVVGSSTSASDYAARIINSANTTLAAFRNDGAASVNTSTLTANTLTVGGNLTVGGTLAATMNAANVSAGQFGANTGGGNFSFPGSVAIGATTPTSLLTVKKDQAGNTIMNISNANAAGTTLLSFDSDQGANAGFIFQAGSGYASFGGPNSLNLESYAKGPIAFFTRYNNADIERMRITSSGYIGIGTQTPGYLLTVNGSISASGNTIQNVGTPVNLTDAANKSYVDTKVAAAASGPGSWTCTVRSYPVGYTISLNGYSSSSVSCSGSEKVISGGCLSPNPLEGYPGNASGGQGWTCYNPSSGQTYPVVIFANCCY